MGCVGFTATYRFKAPLRDVLLQILSASSRIVSLPLDALVCFKFDTIRQTALEAKSVSDHIRRLNCAHRVVKKLVMTYPRLNSTMGLAS